MRQGEASWASLAGAVWVLSLAVAAVCELGKFLSPPVWVRVAVQNVGHLTAYIG